jgi:RNase P subunit RPR2
MSTSTRATNLRTVYLQDAAQSLASTSPSTASYLASESIQFEPANGTKTEAAVDHRRQTFCTACGNVFLPGWNCSITRGDKRPAEDSLKTPQRRTLGYHCQACHHDTKFYVPSLERVDEILRKEDMPCSKASELGLQNKRPPGSTATPAKTGSKKRAKTRKENASLQLLLKKSKEALRAAPQLDFIDLGLP